MKPGPVKGVPFKWQPDELFKLCVWADKHGHSMAKTLAERYGITEHNARARISRLRQLGYDVPAQLGWNGQEVHGCGSAAGYQRHLREGSTTCEACRAHNNARVKSYRATGTTAGTPTFTPPSTDIRFQCDCGAWFYCEPSEGPQHALERLRRHTIINHGRGPFSRERMPQ